MYIEAVNRVLRRARRLRRGEHERNVPRRLLLMELRRVKGDIRNLVDELRRLRGQTRGPSDKP